jgi:hypothetical protein
MTPAAKKTPDKAESKVVRLRVRDGQQVTVGERLFGPGRVIKLPAGEAAALRDRGAVEEVDPAA